MTTPRQWYAILPPKAVFLEWLCEAANVTASGERWETWLRVMERLREQGRLDHVALPHNVEFVTALEGVIRDECQAELLTPAQQLFLFSTIRDSVSPGLAGRNTQLRANAAKGGAARSGWTDDEKNLVVNDVERSRTDNPSLSVNAAAGRVLALVEHGKLPGVRAIDKAAGRRLDRADDYPMGQGSFESLTLPLGCPTPPR